MLHLYIRVGGQAARVAARLEEIAASTRAGMARLWARQAAAARDGDPAALEAVATDYERVGARVYAAETAAQAAIAHRAGAAATRPARAGAGRPVCWCLRRRGADACDLDADARAYRPRAGDGAARRARSEQRSDRRACHCRCAPSSPMSIGRRPSSACATAPHSRRCSPGRRAVDPERVASRSSERDERRGGVVGVPGIPDVRRGGHDSDQHPAVDLGGDLERHRVGHSRGRGERRCRP